MKKTIVLTMILFLALGLTMSAQSLRVKRYAVGTGGFINNTTTIGKMSGLFGQAIAGKLQDSTGSKEQVMYLGFWSPVIPKEGIEEDIILQRGIYNYPNPVSDVTNFNFNLSEPSFVTIKIYNSLGSLVATVVNGEMHSEGANSVSWNVRNANVDMLSAGSYSYEMLYVPANSKSKPAFYRNVMIISK